MTPARARLAEDAVRLSLAPRLDVVRRVVEDDLDVSNLSLTNNREGVRPGELWRLLQDSLPAKRRIRGMLEVERCA